MKGFCSLVMHQEVIKVLEGMEIDPYMLVDMSGVIFHEDSKYVRQSKGYLLFPSFLEVILEFRASQSARVTDVVELRRSAVEQQEMSKQRIITVEKAMAEINEDVNLLLKHEGIDEGTPAEDQHDLSPALSASTKTSPAVAEHVKAPQVKIPALALSPPAEEPEEEEEEYKDLWFSPKASPYRLVLPSQPSSAGMRRVSVASSASSLHPDVLATFDV